MFTHAYNMTLHAQNAIYTVPKLIPFKILENNVAIFTFEGDDIAADAEHDNLVKHVFDYVTDTDKFLLERPVKELLPDTRSQCGPLTRLALESVRNMPQYRSAWLSLFGFSRFDSRGTKLPGNFHEHIFANIHQTPCIYYKGNFYFFDFNNYFAQQNKEIKTSVLIIPADKYFFEKILTVTHSDLDGGWFREIDNIDIPSDQLDKYDFRLYIGSEENRMKGMDFLKTHHFLENTHTLRNMM